MGFRSGMTVATFAAVAAYNNLEAENPELCVWRSVLFMIFVSYITLFEN